MRLSYSDPKPKVTGKRIFVFIVGGATRSEVKYGSAFFEDIILLCMGILCIQIQRFAHDLFPLLQPNNFLLLITAEDCTQAYRTPKEGNGAWDHQP